jgi:AraC-like DNA-binding protein
MTDMTETIERPAPPRSLPRKIAPSALRPHTREAGSNPVRASAREFNSPEEYAALNGLAGIRMNGPVPRGFKAHMTFMELNGVRVRSGAATVGLNLIGSLSDTHVFTFATQPAQTRLMSGREVSHEALFHPRPNEMLATRSPSNEPFPWASISISYELMARVGPDLAGRQVVPRRDDATVLRTVRMARARLLGLVKDIARLTVTTPEIADSPEGSRALADVLLDALVDCLSGGVRDPDRAAVRRHHRILGRLETVLREGGDAILSVSGLCGAVGASERTLHEVCMNFVGMPPMRYVRMWRLSAIREALQAASPRDCTVSEIAMRHGFWEFSRFALAYREAFGEAPSDTLRRG